MHTAASVALCAIIGLLLAGPIGGLVAGLVAFMVKTRPAN